MKTKVFGDGDRTAIFIMGWGNRIDGENERWLIEKIEEEGFKVHVFEIPTSITDFEDEYLKPVKRYMEDLDVNLVLSHSTGGLIASYLDVDARKVYLAPWWGIYGMKLRGKLEMMVTKIPTSAKFIPSEVEPEEIGDLMTEEAFKNLPNRVSPAFVSEIRKAQDGMPEISDEATILCSLCDTVVNLKAIGKRVSSEQVVLYDGGHEIFSSGKREKEVKKLLKILSD